MTRKQNKKDEIDFSQIAAEVQETSVSEFVFNNYLPYAYYVITNRALISDDGLKPVNRRIIQTMYNMGITPNKPYVKAASIAGNTVAKYHPHGTASVEDALARMAQGFVMRVPLIDNYGHVGEIAGDTAASARYWEARLTPQAIELVKEINDGAAELTKNYDGTLDEAIMLPSRWPSGIINGSDGIAVGYACDIPPHNPTEVMKAVIALIKNPDLTVDELLKIMPGPDMPSGGQLIGIEGVRDYYMTGKGTFTVRGVHITEPLTRGRTAIIFTELPYQVSPERVIKAIKEAKSKGNLKEISEYKDLSDIDNGLRLHITVKAGANITAVIKSLYKHTPIEQKFSPNMTVLRDNYPQQLGMLSLLEQFVAFRTQSTINRSIVRMGKVDKAIERLEGIIKVAIDIDKAISIIRKSETAEIASTKLQKTFKINEEQADYILSMALRRLTKADTLKMHNEIEDYKAEKEELTKILNNSELLNDYIIEDLTKTMEVIKDKRRTVVIKKSAEALAKEEKQVRQAITKANKNSECFVTLFANGLISCTEEPYTQGKAKLPIVSSVRTKTQEELVVIMRNGQAHKIPVIYVTSEEPVSVDTLGLDSKNIVGLGRYEADRSDHGLLVVTSSGGVNVISGGYPLTTSEFQAVKLADDEEVVMASQVSKSDSTDKNVLMVSEDGYVLYFKISEVRTSNSGAGTIKGMVTDTKVVNASVVGNEGVVVSCSHNTVKTTNFNEIPIRKRGAKGVILQRLTKDDVIVNAFASDSVVGMKNDKAIKLPSETPRATTGEKRSGLGVILGHLN